MYQRNREITNLRTLRNFLDWPLKKRKYMIILLVFYQKQNLAFIKSIRDICGNDKYKKKESKT